VTTRRLTERVARVEKERTILLSSNPLSSNAKRSSNPGRRTSKEINPPIHAETANRWHQSLTTAQARSPSELAWPERLSVRRRKHPKTSVSLPGNSLLLFCLHRIPVIDLHSATVAIHP